MAKFKVVYIDGRPGDGVIERRVLETRDAELVLGGCTTDDEVVAVAGDAPAILNGMYRMGPSLFERLPSLRVVVRRGVGFDNIDLDAATAAGVVVCNVKDYGFNEVANHAFAMLLALNRNLIDSDKAVRQGVRRPAPKGMPHTGRISGETLGLVAFGTIARAVARRAQGFGMRVVAYDPYVDVLTGADLGVELLPLEEVLRSSDYLSVHVPLSDETRGMLGPKELALMKPSAYLVLTSRGGIVDEAALADALGAGRIAGAGIDVWAHEPVVADDPLLRFDNVIATPHFAWYSEVSVVSLSEGFAEAAADVLHGIMPRSVVNPAVLERVRLAPRLTE